ncbi:MAG: hypothetical protein K8F54_13685 [Altibacter sp.]|uniref:hypothetical protein n=1 Tax=Altibacter sp. TaxID=2024823 RepID=UPI001D1B1FF0|nr:hypothetical protein [Altibacter sp.]MBZ0328653.1 hypothetical protein [Altibacter sp.]
MKNKIFMYLFFFAVLFILFQYMNEKTIFESQEKKIASLTEKFSKAEDSISVLTNRVSELNYFTLLGNQNAMDYLESTGREAAAVEAFISDAIYDQNLVSGGNPLVPFDGMNGAMLVNKIKFLNHKWLLADFSDGTYWGEMLLEYSFNEAHEMELHTLASLLYPAN